MFDELRSLMSELTQLEPVRTDRAMNVARWRTRHSIDLVEPPATIPTLYLVLPTFL
jgi:hypothetical protein